jgi:L-lactate dehydrogenase complex protein LldG
MEESTPREKILKRVRQALLYKSKNPYANIDLDSAVFAADERELKLRFAANFTGVSGHFVYCDNEYDYADNFITILSEKKINRLFCNESALADEFRDLGLEFTDKQDEIFQAGAAITSCEALVARTGSILLSSRKNGRLPSISCPVHFVKAYSSQLVGDMKDSLLLLKNKYGSNLPSMLCYASGPSRTFDIGQTEVIGAQGPKEVYVLLIEDQIKKSS